MNKNKRLNLLNKYFKISKSQIDESSGEEIESPIASRLISDLLSMYEDGEIEGFGDETLSSTSRAILDIHSRLAPSGMADSGDYEGGYYDSETGETYDEEGGLLGERSYEAEDEEDWDSQSGSMGTGDVEEDYESIFDDHDEYIYLIVEQSFGEGDIETGIDRLISEEADSAISLLSNAFSIISEAYGSANKEFPVDSLKDSGGEEIGKKIDSIRQEKKRITLLYNKIGLNALKISIENANNAISLLEEYKQMAEQKASSSEQEDVDSDAASEGQLIFGPQSDEKRRRAREKARGRARKYKLTDEVAPSAILEAYSDLDQMDFTSGWQSLSGSLSSFSDSFFSNIDSDILNGIEDGMPIEKIEEVIRDNFEKFSERVSSEILLVKTRLVDTSIGMGGSIANSSNIGLAINSLNNLYASLWVWDQINKSRISKMSIGYVNKNKLSSMYSIIRYLRTSGRSTLRSFVENATLCSRAKIMFRRIKNDEGKYDDDLSARFTQEVINQITNKVVAAINDGSNKENIVKYIGTIPLNQTMLKINARDIIDTDAGTVISKNVVNNKYTKCPVCSKQILWGVYGRGSDKEKIDKYKQENFGDFRYIEHSFYRADGSLIDIRDLISGPNEDSDSWRSKTYSGNKTWTEINTMIYSGSKEEHAEGLIRRSEVLAYLGGQPLNGGKEVRIRDSRFGCPYDSEDDHCGLSVSEDGYDFRFGWNGVSQPSSNLDDSNKAARLDQYGKRQDGAYYTNSISEGNEEVANRIARKYGNGGYKFSKHCFSCPCRITDDVAKDDKNFLYRYNYVAIPYFGLHSEENISNYQSLRDGRPIGLPTTPSGELDMTIPSDTIGYVICGASTSLSSFSRGGESTIEALFRDIDRAEQSGDKPAGTLKRFSEWLISNGVDPFDIYEFVYDAKYRGLMDELPPEEGEPVKPVPASTLPDDFFGGYEDREYTDLYAPELQEDSPQDDEGARTIRRPNTGLSKKDSALIQRSKSRKNSLKIINLTSSYDINKSKRMSKIAELLSTAMAKAIDSEIYDILGDLVLTCPNGHKFSISSSINFARNHTARKVRGITKVGEYNSEHNAQMANGSFDTYLKLGIIEEVSSFDRSLGYEEWSMLPSSKREPTALSFVGPDGKRYKISDKHAGNRGFLASAWNTRAAARLPYSFVDPIFESRMNYDLSDKEYVQSRSTTKGEDDSGEAAALEAEMVKSVEEAKGGEEANITDDARVIDEQMLDDYYLVDPIPHPSRLASNADTVRIQIRQLSIAVQSILGVIAQWRDRAVDSSFNMAFAYPENICCTEEDYRVIKSSIPEIIDLMVAPEELESVSNRVYQDLKINLFDNYMEGVDLNRIHLTIPNYTYEYVSDMIYENIASSIKSVLPNVPDDITIRRDSDAFSNIVNILFPLKRFNPSSQKASYGKELVRKEFVGKLYMVAYAIQLSRTLEDYSNNYHNPASSNYIGYALPISIDSNSAFNIDEEQISGFPSEVIRDLERGADQLLDSDGNLVGEIQYETDESGAILNENQVLRKIKSAYQFAINKDLQNIDSVIFSKDVLDTAREYISNMAIDKIVEPISNTDGVLSYMDRNNYVQTEDGSYSYEDRIRAISDILDQARAIEDAGAKVQKAGDKNKKLIAFLKQHGIDPVFYRNKTIFDAMTSSSQIATISMRPYMDEWQGDSGQNYIQPYQPMVPSSLKVMFAYPAKEVVRQSLSSIIGDDGKISFKVGMRYPIISVPSHSGGYLISEKRGADSGHYVMHRTKPLGFKTEEIQGRELEEFISSKRLYEVDAYTNMLDNMAFKIWFISASEYPVKGVSSSTYSSIFGHLDNDGKAKKDLKADISSILDHPATETGIDENGNEFYTNALFNYDSRLWQIGRVGKSRATGAVFSYPVSKENIMKYDSPVGIILPFDLSPSASNMGTNQERNLAKVFRNALPIADINFVVEIDNRLIDVGFLMQRTRGAFFRKLSSIDEIYGAYKKEIGRIRGDSSTSAEEKAALESRAATEMRNKASEHKNSVSRLNYAVRTSESASKRRPAQTIAGDDPVISALSITDTPLWRSSIRPSIPLVDPQTAYRLISGEQYSISGISPILTSEEKQSLYKFIVDIYGLNVIGKIFAPLMERGVGSTLSPEEILNLENIVKDYAKQSLGEELTDEQYMWNEKVKGSRDKGTPAERVQMILDQLNALRPNVVSTSGGKRTNLTVKKNNHLHNVMGMDPGMYYNLSQESTISYVPVSIPVELFGQEWKKSPSWAPIDTESVVQTRDIQRGYRIDEDGNKIPARDALLAGRINASTLDYFRGTQDDDVDRIDQFGAEMIAMKPGTATSVEGIVGLASKMKRTLLSHIDRKLRGLTIKKSNEKNDLLNKISYRRMRLFSIIKGTRRGADYKLK